MVWRIYCRSFEVSISKQDKVCLFSDWHDFIPDMGGPNPRFSPEGVLRFRSYRVSLEIRSGGREAFIASEKMLTQMMGETYVQPSNLLGAQTIFLNEQAIYYTIFCDEDLFARTRSALQNFASSALGGYLAAKISSFVCDASGRSLSDEEIHLKSGKRHMYGAPYLESEPFELSIVYGRTMPEPDSNKTVFEKMLRQFD